jgi:hypothetical protein
MFSFLVGPAPPFWPAPTARLLLSRAPALTRPATGARRHVDAGVRLCPACVLGGPRDARPRLNHAWLALSLSLPSRHLQQPRQQLRCALSPSPPSSQRPCRPTISRLRWPTAPPRPPLPRAPASAVVFAKVKPNRAFPLRRSAMTTERGSPWLELFRYCSPYVFLSTVSTSLL